MGKPVKVEHEFDAAWIIALWKAIHNGDPPWEIIAMEAIAALTATLAGRVEKGGSFSKIQGRLKEIGVEIEAPVMAKGAGRPDDIVIGHTYCVVFKGERVCITIKRPSLPPPSR